MPEILLHYIWQRGIFMGFPQQTTMGQKVEVLSVGQHNTNAGPDFTNVRVRIDGVELVGNVEIHIKSSDWYVHHHEHDAAYDNILLHVVKHADKPVLNSIGKNIPQLELQYPLDKDYIKDWLTDARKMDSPEATHPCAHHLLNNPHLITDDWCKTLLRIRLDCKKQSIQRLLTYTNNDQEQMLYIMLAHHWGFHINGVPMEQLALQTPLSVLRKHRDSLFQIQAILLGQSGLLAPIYGASLDNENEQLWKEYCFLRKKFNLQALSPSVWKKSRTRPQNQPEVRIRQFAQLICRHDALLSKILEAHCLEDLRSLMDTIPMGQASVDSLIINVFVPIKYHKGQTEEALTILQTIPAEKNSVITQWKMLGQQVHSAADTQALIHLYMSFCQKGECMHCDVAHQIFLRSEDEKKIMKTMQTYVLGLDMGATNSVLGVVDGQGQVIARDSIKTQDYSQIDSYMEALCGMAERLMLPYGGVKTCKGMGAGVPNGNFYTGMIERAVNLPWHENIPFAQMVKNRLGIPCLLTNDANAAAMGEMKYGVAQTMKDFIMITLGSGVGSGIVINGRLLYGHDGFAGELGHTCVDHSANARPCNCGLKGCLETYASANGMARTAKELMEKGNRDSLLCGIPVEQITSKDIFDAAEQGDALAQEIFTYTGTILGRAMASFVAFSAPEAIVLFGGLTKSGHWIMDPVVKALNENVLPLWRNKVKVMFSALKEADAAILGAASLID